jgi:hypothetical protein
MKRNLRKNINMNIKVNISTRTTRRMESYQLNQKKKKNQLKISLMKRNLLLSKKRRLKSQ